MNRAQLNIRYSPRNAKGEKPYIIQPIDGKGMGAIAIKSIKFGDLILSEQPLFTVKSQLGIVPLPVIVKKLVPKSDIEKRQYINLANCHVGAKHPFIGIYETNALPCGPTGGDKVTNKGAIFLEACRFNSSCIPNTINYWNAAKGVIEFRALKDVDEGEELCICYTKELQSREARRNILRSKFGFICQCAACSLSTEEVKASDNRRATLASLVDEIGECGNRPADGLKKAKLGLRLTKEEGIIYLVRTFTYDAFQFCVITSDLKHAKEWIREARKAASCIWGPDAAQGCDEYVQNPKKHPSWGAGWKMTLEGPDE
ncbi:hypothetical protein HWV62_18742 [Athelia sp. TMB]|nr:hypothetical protein HWV62_18742 [Athelia sp. TMB]